MRNTGIEILANGVEIDWDSSLAGSSVTEKKHHIRKIRIKCTNCGSWRWVNSSGLAGIRRGQRQLCWDCHRVRIGLRNVSRSPGRRQTQQGYIVRTLSSFSEEERCIIAPMCRRNNRKRPRAEVLEHRAVVALRIGRPLTLEEVVHHKNGIKDDNAYENLELTDPQAHGVTHKELREKCNALYLENQKLKAEIKRLRED